MINNKVKILIAEDEYITAMDFKKTLLAEGFKVTAVVSTGEDLIKEIEREIPTLIISDINLRGELDGIEAIARIQEQHSIPFIYITAYKDFKRVVEIYNLKPYDYVLKPVESTELAKIVKSCLNNIVKETEIN